MSRSILVLAVAAVLLSPPAEARKVVREQPSDIVDLATIAPAVRVEMMYWTNGNFLGRPVAGYHANRCFLVKAAAEAIHNAQERLETIARKTHRRLTLVVRDCYRPQKAVDDFVTWAKDPSDKANKETYYPDLTKPDLIKLNYISPVSGHSRASAVDLTIAEVGENGETRELSMGTIVDFFGEKSHTQNPKMPRDVMANRLLLFQVMQPEFKNYSKEWWHYALKTEPYPGTAFDFDILP